MKYKRLSWLDQVPIWLVFNPKTVASTWSWRRRRRETNKGIQIRSINLQIQSQKRTSVSSRAGTSKGIRFGGQVVVKAFAVRRASPLEPPRLINAPPSELSPRRSPPFPSTTMYVPTNFSVLAQRAWRTLTLGLGAHKSKLVVFVFESEAMKPAVDRLWAAVIPLGNVNKQLVRGLAGCELARFKLRKGSLTFYVFAVRRAGVGGFGCVDDLRWILEAIAALKDFVDLTTVLALPTHPRITSSDAVAMAT